MKFGLAFPYNHTRYTASWAQQAEEYGWDGVFLGDAIWCEDPIVGLAAAAAATTHLQLGTMIIPTPLRRPWKLASESIALDQLSGGRFIMGLGTGAVWMGWHGFPDAVTDNKDRATILDETIDILTLLFLGKPFDYEGRHFHLKLTQLDEIFYPPKPKHAPRLPLWVPAIWPRETSLQRAIKCDGVIVEKRSPSGTDEAVTPQDIRDIKKHVAENRPADAPFDIVINGNTAGMSPNQRQENFAQLQEAGATWWVEGLWDGTPESVPEFIRQSPPTLT